MSITIAIPSKGRLKDDTFAAFARVGLEILPPHSARSYSTHVKGRDDIKIKLLSASEIAKEIIAGTIDLGVTGKDLLFEVSDETHYRASLLSPSASPDVVPLGFGKADVIVAVPNHWLDVTTMLDLSDVAADFHDYHQRRLRVATKYFELTHYFFDHIHGIKAYEIVESKGATEAAPSTGLADLIVDITSTGETLRDNHLRIVNDGRILTSQACLVKSLNHIKTPNAFVNEIIGLF
jgi:ATP phosphoribosyltransferase